MSKITGLFLVAAAILLLGGAAALRAQVSASDQTALRTQYAKKVLIFRKSYRTLDRLEVNSDGRVAGDPQPGFWSMDGACQVKDLDFGKDRVTVKCAKLWANVKDDGRLHYFPASAALKGKSDYPQNIDVVFRVANAELSASDFKGRMDQIFLRDGESLLGATPAPIAAYIQKMTIEPDFDPTGTKAFDGTPPKAISTPSPDLSREAALVGQAGKEDFVALVDDKGKASVMGFTHILQYGLEETTMEAVKTWKFEPAMKDGKPVPVRMALEIEYKRPNPK
ncbi:MAG: energy transducer TonB [Acidobacteriia bacterium]|nr:energy transducer TonB [Terriglobia bacterium]